MSTLIPSIAFARQRNQYTFINTPFVNHHRYGSVGVAGVIFPVSMMRAAMHAASNVLACIKNTGGTSDMISSMQTRDEMYRLLNYDPSEN